MTRIAASMPPMRAFLSTLRPLALRTAPAMPALHRFPFPAATTQLAAAAAPQTTSFSTSAALQARKKVNKQDQKTALIAYFLFHPRVPRPLRFSRMRALRHWTIHRAWMLFLRRRRADAELELERQYNSMAHACETLRLMDERGIEGLDVGAGSVGRLFRTSMKKDGIWEGVPIEYGRPQVDTPTREGWNHEWKR